jgi:hypothetical protein
MIYEAHVSTKLEFILPLVGSVVIDAELNWEDYISILTTAIGREDYISIITRCQN